MLGTYHLNSLFDILSRIYAIHDPDELWAFTLEQTCKALQSEAAVYLKMAPDEQTLHVTAAFGPNAAKVSKFPFRVGTGISGWVAQYRQPLLILDVRQDSRFNRQADTATGFQTKSALCLPIFSQGSSFGVIEVLNRKSGQFNAQDQEFLTLLGRQVSIAYENLGLVKELSGTKMILESLVENMSGGLIAIDQKENILLLNSAAGRLLKMKETGLKGKPSKLVFMDLPWFETILHDTLTTKTTVSRQETMLTINGQPERIGYTTNLISTTNQELVGAGIIFQKLSA